MNKYLEPVSGDRVKRGNTRRDPDDSNKSREFYRHYWWMYDPVYFRGETLISFGTNAGWILRKIVKIPSTAVPKSKRNRLKLIEESSLVPNSTKQLARKFYEQYHCLANFMPLPRMSKADSKYNLNLVKGSKTFWDYPDLFLPELHNYFLHRSGKLTEAMEHPRNRDWLFGFGTWPEFVEANYLQTFYKTGSDYTSLEQLRPARDGSLDERIDYFFTTALNLIERRANLLANSQPISKPSILIVERH